MIPYFLELLEAEAEAEAEAEIKAEAEAKAETEVEADEMDIKDEAEVDIDNEANNEGEVEVKAEAEDKRLYLAVVEALALVFERGSLEKFYSQPNESFCNVSNLFKVVLSFGCVYNP